MRAVTAIALCLGVDTLATLTVPTFLALANAEYKFRIGYIDHISKDELDAQLESGIAFIPVTYANEFDPAHTVARLQALGIPKSATVFLDCEAESTMDPATLIAKINAWAAAVIVAGYIAGMYVGAACPLTSAELTTLAVTRYMQGCSRLVDRNSMPQVPARGYCVIQGRPYNTPLFSGIPFDVDFITQDYHDDVPTWVIGN